jgi:hypothetical protein
LPSAALFRHLLALGKGQAIRVVWIDAIVGPPTTWE